MATHIQKLIQVNAAELFSALADRPYTLFLDSANRNHPDAKYSYLTFDPVEIITLDDCGEHDPFSYVQNRIAHWHDQLQPEHNPNLPPFQGGAAGLFGYDLARTIEKLPNTAAPSGTPELAIGIYNKVIAFDHEQNEAWFIEHRQPNCIPRGSGDLSEFWQTDSCFRRKNTKTNIDWQTQFSPIEYQKRIARVIEYIRAGDVFQANLSQRFTATVPEDFDPAVHYLHMRKSNPAPFAGYMNLGNVKISSASPERFLKLTDGYIETKPIKGTAPRFPDQAKDAQSKNTLLASEKDRAENIMIVDLLRNDLSKVCEIESIDVPKLCALESFASVHHLVSTITGTLKQDKSALDLLRAAFPGGSITGAPKIRAMEIIEELEEEQRGPYCGSLGYIGFNGDMDTNILIRTLIYKNDTVSLNAGGGITIASDPAAEYQETLDKAAAIFESFATLKKAETA